MTAQQRNECHPVKIPTSQKFTPSPQIFESPSPEFFQPTQTKRQSVMAGGAGVESQKYQEFLLGIVLISILQQSSDNSRHYAGTTSESIWVKCGSLLDFDLAKFVSSIDDLHTSERGANKDAHRCSVVHDFAYLSEAANSQPRTC